MTVIINPGTEPIPEATVENAEFCVQAFINQLYQYGEIDGLTYERRADMDEGGRFGFVIFYQDDSWHRPSVTVDMPGCEPERTMKGKPWYSPRLYVNGSSWLWGYALDIADSRLKEEPDAS